MRIYISKILVVCTFFLTTILGGCVQSSPFFGNELVPPNQIMNTYIDSSINLSTYIIAMDSIKSSNLGAIMFIGQHNSKMTGRTTAQFYANYSPYGFYKDTEGDEAEPDIEVNFGKNPRIDSLVLTFNVAYKNGDSLQRSKLEIFQIKDFLFKRDSLYYSNFDLEKYIEPTPFYTTDITGDKEIKYHFPIEYARQYLDVTPDTTNMYYRESGRYNDRFHKKFKGFYFKVTPYGDRGAFYDIDLANTFMYLYYNNKSFESAPDTTLVQPFVFYNTTLGIYNTTVQTYKHDYSKSDQAVGGVNPLYVNDTLTPQPICYVSGMGGLGSLVEISTEGVERFIAKAKEKFGEQTAIGVHKAEIVWNKIDKSWEDLDQSFASVGLYFNYSKFSFIPDYSPSYMTQANVANSFGLLNRSRGVYTTDVTQYFQKIINGNAIPKKFQLYPEYQAAVDSGEANVWGSQAVDAKLKPYLVITYTLVK